MTANLENISSSLLKQIQTNDEYNKYFRNTQSKKSVSEAKSLSEISLAVSCVSLKAIDSGHDRIILEKFPFAKNDTENGQIFVTEECLDNVLHDIDVINDLQNIDEQQDAESVKKHATARILLFYRTCAAYYNSKPTEMIRYTRATTQIGKGIKQNDTEACHHAIFCEFENDIYYAASLREKLKNFIANSNSKTEKKVTSVLKKLLFLGVEGARIEQFLKKQRVGVSPSDRDLDTIFSQELLTSKLINDKCRLFYQNNHTLIAKGEVNGADDCIEHRVRYLAIPLLNRCAREKKITPIHATLEFAQEIVKAATEGLRFLDSDECATCIDQLSNKIPAYTRSITERTTVDNYNKKREALQNVKIVLEELADNWSLKDFFTGFTTDIKTILTELDTVLATAEPHFSAALRHMQSRTVVSERLAALQEQIEKKQTEKAELERTPTDTQILEVSLIGSKLRLAQLKKDEDFGTRKKEVLKNGSIEEQNKNECELERVKNSITLYNTLLEKVDRKQPLTSQEMSKLKQNFEAGKKEKIRFLQNELSEKIAKHAHYATQMQRYNAAVLEPFSEIDRSLAGITHALQNLSEDVKGPDRRVPSTQTINKIKPILLQQKSDTDFLAQSIKEMIAETSNEDLNAYSRNSHLTAIRRAIHVIA